MADILDNTPVNGDMTIFKTEVHPEKLNACIDNMLQRLTKLEVAVATLNDTIDLDIKAIDLDTELQPCPFCGKSVNVLICDSEGNIKDEEYAKHPYSGLTYAIEHTAHIDITSNINCPIAHLRGDHLGIFLYDSMEELIENWNRRS